MLEKTIGRRGETAAANYLQTRGWQIKARNYKVGHHEIDLIAKKNGQIYLFEIKTRSQANTDELISDQQKRSLRQAHLEFCEQNKLPPASVAYGLIAIFYQGKQAALIYYPNFL